MLSIKRQTEQSEEMNRSAELYLIYAAVNVIEMVWQLTKHAKKKMSKGIAAMPSK